MGGDAVDEEEEGSDDSREDLSPAKKSPRSRARFMKNIANAAMMTKQNNLEAVEAELEQFLPWFHQQAKSIARGGQEESAALDALRDEQVAEVLGA